MAGMDIPEALAECYQVQRTSTRSGGGEDNGEVSLMDGVCMADQPPPNIVGGER